MRQFLASVLLFLGFAPASFAQSSNWVYVELRSLPFQCSHPVDCIERSTLLVRNFIAMQPALRSDLTMQLNAMASIRGIPDSAVENLYMSLPNLSARFHVQPDPERFAALINHPGVYFDPTALDDGLETRHFAQYVQTELAAAGVRFLTAEELELTPGRPTLSVRFTPRRELESCIHPFFISMAITEEVVLTRDPSIRITTNVWSSSIRQDLGSLDYGPESGLREVVARFVTDWQAAHAEG